jgi:hypothetical protein
MLAKLLIVLLSVFLALEARLTAVPFEQSCIVGYLKAKGKLEADFSEEIPYKALKCEEDVAIALKQQESWLRSRLSEKESIKIDCVMREIKAANALDCMLVLEILISIDEVNEEKAQLKFDETSGKMKEIFESAAQVCESDPSYAGAINQILKIRNESLEVQREKLCTAKFLKEHKWIDVEEINPHKVQVSDEDCETLVTTKKDEDESKVLKTNESKGFSDRQIHCLMRNYRENNMFEINKALEVVNDMDIPVVDKRRNLQKITDLRQKFLISVPFCFM